MFSLWGLVSERTEETKLRQIGNMHPSRASSVVQELVVKSPACLEVKGHTGVVTGSNRWLSPPFPSSLSSICNCEGKHCRSHHFLHPADPPTTTTSLAPALFCMLNTLLISSAAPMCEVLRGRKKTYLSRGVMEYAFVIGLVSLMHVRNVALWRDTVKTAYAYIYIHMYKMETSPE